MWLTLHPQLKVSNGKSLHMPAHVLCLKRGNSCFLLLCIWVTYPGIANLWIYGFSIEKDVCFDTFCSTCPTLQNLPTWRSPRERNYGKCQKERWINIIIHVQRSNIWPFQTCLNWSSSKLPTAIIQRCQTNLKMVQNYSKPHLHRKEACVVKNVNIQGTALFQLI